MTELTYDPYDYEIDRDPHPTWRRLRDEAPVYYNADRDFYALSRYDDVLAALLDWETYSSGRGTVLELITTDGEPTRNPTDDLGQMIFSDPPGHDVARSVVNRSFTPRQVGYLESRIRMLCRERLDHLDGTDRFDYLEDFCARIPAMIIGELLGVPTEDQEMMGRWADMMMAYDPAMDSGDKIGLLQDNPVRIEGTNGITEYTAALAKERAANPKDDLLSHLLQAELALDDGTTRRLERVEVVMFFTLLFGAGSETTARLFGWTAVLLARHPEQRSALATDPTLIPGAIEELLRYEAPSPIQARLVTRDVRLHDTTIPAMSKIALLNGAACRDEREYPEPDRFDVTRQMDRHLNFGYATHFCLGAALARLEGRVVLDEMLSCHPTWEVDDSDVEMVHTTTVRGPARVPITV